jgi:iron complex transport system permease protein
MRAVARLELRFRRLSELPGFWAVVLSATLVVAALVASMVGAAALPAIQVPSALVDPDHPAHGILWNVRLPRIAAGMIVGATLGVSGALMQAVVRNPLADPGIMGVTAGAGFGGLLGIVLWPASPMLVPALAFGGGLVAIAVVLGAASSGTRVLGPLRIVLSGVAMQAILFSLIALVTFFFADRAPAFVSFTIGSLAGLGWQAAGRALVPAVIGIGIALLATRTLNLLLLDDDSAAGVGLAVRRTRIAASCVAALLAASAASVAGLVGFVGLIVPNWVRVTVGPDHRSMIPLSILGGATLVVVADTAARTLAGPLELPVGALLALIGGPYFLTVLWRKVA